MTCRRAHLGHAGVPIVHVQDALCTRIATATDNMTDDVADAPTHHPREGCLWVPRAMTIVVRSARRDVDEDAWNDAEDDD